MTKKTVQFYLKAAESGDAHAQYMLADMYDNGDEVKKDKEKAFLWYMRAAESGLAIAQFCVAAAYELGEGVGKDIQKAVYWQKKAADSGLEEAQMWLREHEDLLKDDDLYDFALEAEDASWDRSKGAVSEFNSALQLAYEGDFYEQEIVAEHYMDGHGTKRDYHLAAGFFAAAVLSGEEEDVDLRYTKGCMNSFFNKGYGDFVQLYNDFYFGENNREKDLSRALFWAEVGAEFGNVFCMRWCGLMYYLGEGTEVDKEKAEFWLQRAAEEGDEEAQKFLADVKR